ncbi:MAG: GGDEF domain-containing protein [Candidatus Nanopelagicales bacterium]
MQASASGPSWVWSLGLPLLLVAVILLADLIEGPDLSFMGVLVVAPTLSAVFASQRRTALVAVITWLAALAFGILVPDGNAAAQVVRLWIVALVGVGAVIAASTRQRMQRTLTDALTAAAQAEQAQRDANTDWLTGQLNRRGLVADLEQRQVHGVTLIMIDLDGMKRINDTYGHTVGDEVLQAVAGRIRGCTHADDAVGRWGGDEFIVLTAASPEQGHHIARRIGASVRGGPVTTTAGRLAIDISAGVAGCPPGGDVHRALADADDRMYRDKHAGEPPVNASSRLLPVIPR